MAQELGQHKIMANAVAAGAVWALLSDHLAVLNDTLEAMFASKGDAVVAGNQKVAEAGFAKVRELADTRPKPAKAGEVGARLLLKGNDALPLGALAAGLKFMSAYPMTPATGVTEFIAEHGRDLSVLMEQAEDEISAINMAIGASFAGVRAMTATSGGGFALMTEALSLAGSAEIPIVVINAMRPGPSTGLPTRTEQGDLAFAAAMSFGDFPRAVLSPGDPAEAFYLMGQAFNLAEEYQMPVVVLSDQHLAGSYTTVPPFDLSRVEIKRGRVVSGADAGHDYLRYRYTEDGISPRLYPGFGQGVVVSAGDEHDEKGHLIEDGETRQKMMEKRMAKQRLVEAASLETVLCGSDEPDAVLIGFDPPKVLLPKRCPFSTRAAAKSKGFISPRSFPCLAAWRAFCSVQDGRLLWKAISRGSWSPCLPLALPLSPLDISGAMMVDRSMRSTSSASFREVFVVANQGKEFEIARETAWCPGCGNFGILNALSQALEGLGLKKSEVLYVSGIGQAGKTPHYIHGNVLNTLHGRTLPTATGAKLANNDLHVIAIGGDGDGYAEGGNHFLHAIRKNVNITYLVHDNQVFGLTKGQASPRSDQEWSQERHRRV